MGKDLKELLKDEMDKRKIKVPKLATDLDIPKDRIYAWYRDNSNPKGEDRDKIQKWINGEISDSSDNHLSEPVHGYTKVEYREKYFDLLESHDKRFAALEVTINRLTEMLEAERTKANEQKNIAEKTPAAPVTRESLEAAGLAGAGTVKASVRDSRRG